MDARGALSLAGGEDDIAQAIELILGTAPGEREMRPEFGCAVHDLVFDTIDAAMIGKLETAIRGARPPTASAPRTTSATSSTPSM